MYERSSLLRNTLNALLISLVFLILSTSCYSSDVSLNRTDLNCSGRPYYNVTLTAYYPDYTSDNETDYLDSRGKRLRTLQDYIDERETFVTVSIDLIGTGLRYGSNLCVPELNEHFGRRIPLQARDFANNVKGKRFSRLDICVRTDADSYDTAVNRFVTLYV